MAIPATGIILAAAGEGRRLGHRLPKALVPLAGSPLFLHSLRTFARLTFVKEVALVLPGEWIDRVLAEHGRELARLKVSTCVAGGARRQDSVLAGLRALSTPIVLVHDAARPLISRKAVTDVAKAAAKDGAALLAAPSVDTVKRVDGRGRVRETLDRSTIWLAQTPQGFRRGVLERAYAKSGSKDATDDVQLVERMGGRVALVPSESPNFKVTTPSDLARAEELLDKK